MCKLIIFDFDGVIVDSEAIANRVLAAAVTELGRPMSTQEALKIFGGRTLAEEVAMIRDMVGGTLPDDYGDRLQEMILSALTREVRPIDGVADFIAGLGSTRYCIGSTSSPDRLAVCLEAIGLTKAFSGAVFSVADVRRNKPFPDIFLHAAEQMGVEPAATLVIEDSVHGVQAGVAAGMRVIGFTAASHLQTGHEARLIEAGAFATAATYADLARQVKPLINGAAGS